MAPLIEISAFPSQAEILALVPEASCLLSLSCCPGKGFLPGGCIGILHCNFHSYIWWPLPSYTWTSALARWGTPLPLPPATSLQFQFHNQFLFLLLFSSPFPPGEVVVGFMLRRWPRPPGWQLHEGRAFPNPRNTESQPFLRTLCSLQLCWTLPQATRHLSTGCSWAWQVLLPKKMTIYFFPFQLVASWAKAAGAFCFGELKRWPLINLLGQQPLPFTVL